MLSCTRDLGAPPSQTQTGDQAARASPSTGSESARVARAFSINSAAISKHEPQLDPHPVRIVSSATLSQPASAASRIW